MRRMAGVDFVVAPSSFALGALGKLAERIARWDTFALNVASGQLDIGITQPQRHLKSFERLRQPALRDPFCIRFGSIRRSRIGRYSPTITLLHSLLHALPPLRWKQID